MAQKEVLEPQEIERLLKVIKHHSDMEPAQGEMLENFIRRVYESIQPPTMYKVSDLSEPQMGELSG